MRNLRDLLARAHGIQSWEPTPEHVVMLALADALDDLEGAIGTVGDEDARVALVARLRRIADRLESQEDGAG